MGMIGGSLYTMVQIDDFRIKQEVLPHWVPERGQLSRGSHDGEVSLRIESQKH